MKPIINIIFIILYANILYAAELYTKPEQCFQKYIINSPSFKELQVWDNNTQEKVNSFYGIYLDYLNCLSENKLLNASFNCYGNKLSEHEKAICYLENRGAYYNDNVQVTVIADNVYSEYYKYIYNNISKEDRKIIKDIAKIFLKDRYLCWGKNELGQYAVLDEEFYFNKFSFIDCIDTKYSNVMKELTLFLVEYDNGKYKYLVDKIIDNSQKMYKEPWHIKINSYDELINIFMDNSEAKPLFFQMHLTDYNFKFIVK